MNVIIKDQKEMIHIIRKQKIIKIKYPKQVTNYCNRIIKKIKKAQYIIKNVSSHRKGVLSVSEIYQIEKSYFFRRTPKWGC